MVKRFARKLHRMFFVLPPSVTVRTVRDMLIRRHVANSHPETLLAHPIDHQYGIDTGGLIDFQDLQSGKPSDAYNICYGGSQPSIIRKALRMIPDHHNLTFLDVGCGKGRALAVASEFPFRRIVGIELVPDLAEIARSNAAVIGRQFPERTPIEVIEGDALTTRIPDGPVVIYFFHPFYRKIKKGVVKNIENWLSSEESNKAYIVYYNPMYYDLYDKSSKFRRVYAGMVEFDPSELGTGPGFHDSDFALGIWQSVGEPMLEAHPQASARIETEPVTCRTTVIS